MATTGIRGANNGTGTSQIQAATVSNADIHASAAIATTKLADSANFILRGGSIPFTADQSMGNFKLTNLAAPVGANDAARKADVDAAQTGLDVKGSVRVATTVTGTLATAYENADTIDGVTLATGDRILIKDQSAGAENGIYTVNASGAPTRATDADASIEVTAGMFVFVEEGTANADTGWVMTNNGAVTLGTTALVFTQFTGVGTLVAGAGLTKTGNTVDAVGTTNRIVVNANDIDIGTDVVTLTGTQVLSNKDLTAGTNTFPTFNQNTSGTAANVTGTVAIANGGTGQTTAAAAFNALSPLTTGGDLLYGGASGAGTRLANGSAGQVLQSNGTTLAPSWVAAGAGDMILATVQTVTGAKQFGTIGGAVGKLVLAGSTSGSSTLDAAAIAGTTAFTLPSVSTALVGEANFITRETPAGLVNSSNTTYTLANTPVAGSESVFLNGILQEPGGGNDYTISGLTITYLAAPITNDKIRVSYRK